MIKVAFIVPDNRDKLNMRWAPKPVIGYAPQALLDGFAEVGGCEIHVISVLRRREACPAQLAPNIFFHGLHLPFGAWFKTLYATAIIAVRKKTRAIGAHLAHGQGSETFAAIAGALTGIPNVVTLHGIGRQIAKFNAAPPFSYWGMTARLETIALRRADGVVCISTHTQRAVEMDARRTWVAPNAVDARYFLVPRTPIQPPQLLCVGLISRLKNQLGLIRALDPLAARLPFTLVFCGRIEADIEAEFREKLRARPWCQHEGYLNTDGLREKMATAALLVHPTFEDNCPMVILECMAAGIPVAASRIGGVPDLVEPGVTGLLFDPNSDGQICGAVEQLLRDRATAEKFGAAGKAAAEKRFRPRVIAERHLEIYREVIGA